MTGKARGKEEEECGNLDVNSEICIIEIARFAITYAYVCAKDMKHIPLHFIA